MEAIEPIETTADHLAYVSRELANLHLHLAQILGTSVDYWQPSLPIEVKDRAAFDALAGEERTSRPAARPPFLTKQPVRGVTVYFYPDGK